MYLSPLHLAARIARLVPLALCALVLAGCQGVDSLQPAAQVRVIDTSPDAPSLDIYQYPGIYQSQASPSPASPTGLYNIGFGTISSYISTPAGAYTHSAYIAGTQQQLAQARGAFTPGAQYTLLAGDTAASLQFAVLKDQSTPAPAGQTALRFLGQATRSGPVDIYLLPAGFSLAAPAPIATGVTFGSNTGYINAPAGTYSIVAYPTGVAPTTAAPTYTGSQVAYPSTSVRTILLLDQRPQEPSATTPGALQIITAADYDPAAS